MAVCNLLVPFLSVWIELITIAFCSLNSLPLSVLLGIVAPF